MNTKCKKCLTDYSEELEEMYDDNYCTDCVAGWDLPLDFYKNEK